MELEVERQLNSLFELIDQDSRMIELTKLKEMLMKDSSLLSDIEILKGLDSYSSRYSELRKRIFSNSNYLRYQQLENEFYFLILEMNQILNQLTGKRGC